MSKFKKPAAAPPKNIEFLDRLRIEWSSGLVSEYDYFRLRYFCPCAGCVDEFTGVRTLRQENVRPDVKPITGSYVGNYALRINWSDGHSTGIYTFDSLRSDHPALAENKRSSPPLP